MGLACYILLVVCLNTIKSENTELNNGDIRWFDFPTAYTLESTILLNDINKRDKEVSYKVNSTVNVYSTWQENNTEYLLKFELRAPQLMGRGTHMRAEYKPLPSMWDSYTSTEFYAHWKKGIINEIYLDPNEPDEVLNLQRSIVSMFQFNLTDDHSNETDISGTCEVLYEIMSEEVIRKIKRGCSWGDDVSGEVTSRRLTRYSLDEARAPLELYAEEVHEQAGAGGALKARAWLKLRRAHRELPAPDPAAALSDALRNLPTNLAPLSLAMPGPANSTDSSPTVVELVELLTEASGALGGVLELSPAEEEEPDEGGAVQGVAAAARLLAALRAAPTTKLTELLLRVDDQREELFFALGLAGSAAALGAARDLLREPALAHRYLQGLAHAAAPDEAAVMEMLALGEESARVDVAESALLAAGAAGAGLRAAPAVRERLLIALRQCADDECRAVRLRALVNLRRADCVDELLQHAEHGADAAALAALDALAAVPETSLYNATRLRRLERAARGRGPLERRAAALDLLVRRSARAPLSLLPTMGALGTHEPAELRRLAWHGAEALAAEHETVRPLLAPMSQRLGGWFTRAAPAASALLLRDAGGTGGWRAALRSSLVLDAGWLRRAELALAVTSPDGVVDEVASVQLGAEGVKILADTADVVGEPEAVQPRGELALTVGGVRTRRLALSANETASTLHALRPLADAYAALPLLGAGVLQLRRRGAFAVGLSWAGQTAAASARLSGVLALDAEARVSGAWGELSAQSRVWARQRLHVVGGAAKGAESVCVRAFLEDGARGQKLRLRSALGAERSRVERRRTARWPLLGRSLLLAPPVACDRFTHE